MGKRVITQEEHLEYVKIFNDVYKTKGRLFSQVDSDYENSSNLYFYLKRLIDSKKIYGLENMLIDYSLNKIEDLSDKYSKFLDRNYKIELTRNEQMLVSVLDALLTNDKTKTIFLNDFKKLFKTDPDKFFEAIGYDFKTNKSALEIKDVKEIKNNISKLELIQEMSLKTLDTIDTLELSNIELFLKDLFQFQKTEINGWFIEVIKNDFNEIKDIIKEINENNSISPEDKVMNIRLGIFDLINQRGMKYEDNKLVKPFEKFNDLVDFVDLEFNAAQAGLPDIIYFPKDKSKNIVASNISSWETKDKDFSVYHHFYKIAKLNSIAQGFSKSSNIVDSINQSEKNKTFINELIKCNKTDTYNMLKNELQTKPLNEVLNIDKISFTTILESSSLTVYNQQKKFDKLTKEEIDTYKQDFKEVESINTLILLLSIVNNENTTFVSKSCEYNKEIREVDNKILESMLEKVNIGILAKNYGIYTETSNNNIEKSINILMDYVLNENTMNKFEEFNSLKGKGDYSDVFKNYIANAINYIGTYYPEKLLAQKDNILSNKVFSNCVNDLEKLVKTAELNNQIEVSTFVSSKIIDLKNDLLTKTIELAKNGQFDKIDFLQKEYSKIENNYNIYKESSLSDTFNQILYLNKLNEVNKQIYTNISKELSFESIEDIKR